MQQPPLLTDALAALLEGVPRRDLAAAAKAISDGYPAGASSHGIATPLPGAAHAPGPLPASYAACAGVFARVGEVIPDFAPASLLDVGAGTGAASWAAVTAWPGLQSITMLEPNRALRSLAGRLVESGPLAKAEFLSASLDAEKPEAELVVASYVLAE